MVTDELAGTPEGRVAERVRELREERGLTLDDLAQLCFEVGFTFSRQAIHRLEQGQRRVNVNTLMGLACALGVSPLVLMMPPEADVEVTITESVRALAAEVYEWTMGLRPAPTAGAVNDRSRANAWLRLRKYLPYASRASGTLRLEFGVNEEINQDVVDYLRDNQERED